MGDLINAVAIDGPMKGQMIPFPGADYVVNVVRLGSGKPSLVVHPGEKLGKPLGYYRLEGERAIWEGNDAATSRVEPALSLFQWSSLEISNGVASASPTPEMSSDPHFRHRLPIESATAYIAIANAALPDSDPRKITREKIALLRIPHLSTVDGDPAAYPTEELAAFADALESYLPPEK
jgi:hypothetical protein